MNKKINHIIYVILLSCSLNLFGQEKTIPGQCDELGKVSWYRDYDMAIELAKKENKDVLILFQEIPGCSTCKTYGHNVLGHPLMIEAIENLFVPLAVYNNKSGKDKQTLMQFNEPSWNNPVVRIINDDGEDLIKRVAGDYSVLGLYEAMRKVLVKTNKHIPEYFNLLGMELSSLESKGITERYYKMYCFWNGQKQLGKVDGVLNTEAGFMNGAEVVKVKFDSKLISENKLTEYARRQDFQLIEKNNSYRTATDDLFYYLQHTNYKYLPLTELQKSKINSALGSGEPAEKYLSPKQLKWLKQLNNAGTEKEVLVFTDFNRAWDIKNN